MTDFLSQAFPTAEIILVFREHADWLESLYRESAKDGNLVSMNRFLNYKRGCFSSRSLTPYKNVNALDFQYDLIENLFHRKFHKIHLLFFEELRDKPENFFAKLEQITKSKLRLVKQVKENRSYSALTIKILLFIAHIPLLRLMFISNQNSLLNSFMLLTKKYDQSVGSLNLALKTGKFITIPIVLFRRVLLKMGFGIEEKSLRKKRTMRLRRFVDKFEKYIYYDWTMMSKKKQELIRKHYKNDYFFVRNM